MDFWPLHADSAHTAAGHEHELLFAAPVHVLDGVPGEAPSAAQRHPGGAPYPQVVQLRHLGHIRHRIVLLSLHHVCALGVAQVYPVRLGQVVRWGLFNTSH